MTKRVAKVGLTCRLCHPPKHFKDLASAAKHFRNIHNLQAETFKTGRWKGYNTGYWVTK